MELSSILSACARNGVTVTQPIESRKDYYLLTKGDRRLDFYVGSNGYVSNIVYRSPHTDIMTDCFCDSYFDTIKSAMRELNPTGELVRPVRIATPAKPVNPDDVPNDIQVSKNEEKGGIEIHFNDKPSQDIINSLKDKGFRWSIYNRVWWKKFNAADYMWAMNTFVFSKEPCSLTH